MNSVYPRLLFKDKLLAEEEQEFLNDVFQEELFRTELILKKFNNHFADFIDGYNKTAENNIKDFIMRIEEEYYHQISMLVSVIKRKITDHLQDLIDFLRLQRVIIQFYKINSSQENQQNKWETAYEGIFYQEEMKLKQVVRIKSNVLLLSVTFEVSNATNFIIFRNFQSKSLKKVRGNELLVCNGSDIDSLAFFNNTDKILFIGCIREDKEFITIKEFPFQIDINGSIISASYLKACKEIIYTDTSGKIGSFSLTKNLRDISELNKKLYFQVIISDCQKYFILLSTKELELYNLNLQMLYISMDIVKNAFIEDRSIRMLCFDDQNNILIKNIKITNQNTNDSQNISMDRVHAEFSKSVVLAKELITGLFKKNTYNVETVEVMPSSYDANEKKQEEEKKIN